MGITTEVLEAKRLEYQNKLQMYRNTVIALEGAIEAIDDLLKGDALTMDELKETLGAESIEVIENDKS